MILNIKNAAQGSGPGLWLFIKGGRNERINIFTNAS